MSSTTRLFVWAGGSLFVGSLVLCAYSFMVRWTVARPLDWTAFGMDAAVFTVFALHHSLFARTPVKIRLARLVPETLVRSVYVGAASLLLVAVCVLWRPIGGVAYAHTGWVAVGHVFVQLAGVSLIAQSVRAIDALELAGIRVQTAAAPLQIAGPYRLVRHPLYLGWVLLVFGAARMTGDRLAFAAITTLYLVVAVPWEERSLRAAFGAAYDEYCRRVRWRMIPFIY